MSRSSFVPDPRPRRARRSAHTARQRTAPVASFRRLRAIVYTWSACSFCARAKELLRAKAIDYREVVLDGRKDELVRLQETFGARTLPLVLLDGELLAGLAALETALASE